MQSDPKLINAILFIEENKSADALKMFHNLDTKTQAKVLWFLKGMLKDSHRDKNDTALFDEIISS